MAKLLCVLLSLTALTFLAGYGGMLSLAQMTVAGIAGYIVAILGTSGTPEISLGWPWWLVVVLAVMGVAGAFGVPVVGIFAPGEPRRTFPQGIGKSRMLARPSPLSISASDILAEIDAL